MGTTFWPAAAMLIMHAAAAVGLDANTPPRTAPIRLLVTREVTTKTARSGDRFPMQVISDVTVNGRVIVPAGAQAFGEVTSASESGVLGKSGKLAARLVEVKTAAGPIVLKGAAGGPGPHGAATTIASTVGFALLGAGPLGLLTRGTNAKIKAGDVLEGEIELPTEAPVVGTADGASKP